MENDNNLLHLALTARNSNARASSLLEIANPVTALSFDLTCTERLLAFDIETAKTQAKRIAYEVMKIFTGESDEVQEVEGGAQEW